MDDDFQQFHLCHCKQCQRATGSAHASNLFTDPDNIKWTAGSEFVQRFDVVDRYISNAFCVKCGSGLPYVSKTGNALVVPAGTLDTSPSIAPNDNIFWAERASWYDDGLSAERWDKFSK
jgi:hypothetical protein